jgi:hypothetical protein
MISLEGDFIRVAPPSSDLMRRLGPLADLAGTWMGNGFSLVSLPPDDENPLFRLRVQATTEFLTFTPIGAPIPDRAGPEQKDISFLGLHYFQQISDASTNQAMHLEPGILLPIPTTCNPEQPETIVRLATIPHGTSLLAIGKAPDKSPVDPKDPKGPQEYKKIKGRPCIPPVDSLPFRMNTPEGARENESD